MDHTTPKLHLRSIHLYFPLSKWVCHDFTSIWNLFVEILKLRAFLSKYSDINWWKYSEQFYSNTLTAIGRSLLFCKNTAEKSMASTNTLLIWLKLVVPSSPPTASISGFAKMRQGAKNQFRALPQMHNYARRPIWDAANIANGCIWKDPINSVIKCRVASPFLIKVDFVEN